MTREEFIKKCMFHSKSYFNDGYYKTEAWKKGNELWDSEQFLFHCPECEREVTFRELEFWDNHTAFEEVMNNEVLCSCCYENGMGEDL